MPMPFKSIGPRKPGASAAWGSRAKATVLAGALLFVPSAGASAAPIAASFALQKELVQRSGGEVYSFYAARSYRPVWIGADGQISAAGRLVAELVGTAELDGLDPGTLNVNGLRSAIQAAELDKSPAALTRAEVALSSTFATYVLALRSFRDTQMVYEHETLRPRVPRTYHVLQEAAAAPSLDDYVGSVAWMHPLYAPIRRGFVGTEPQDGRLRQVVARNLARIRAIPATPRHVLVDAAGARLWMYENGRAVDSMKVVVGKPSQQTPLMAGYVRYAIFNPYWNVPTEMVTKTIATNVLRRGVGYLKTSGYQVLSDWSENAQLLDPTKVDWRAAAKGEIEVRVRQVPRATNAMGKVKYEFPNQLGIYLHDTPERALLQKDTRQLSGGCIRLEDAARLGRWLLRGAPVPQGTEPEQRVDLTEIVPIYLTYITAEVSGGQLAVRPDPYGLDAPRPGLADRGAAVP